MATENESYEGLLHAGAGTGLFLVQLSVIVPGLLPTLGLLGVITVLVLVPLLALGLLAGVLIAPVLAAWLLLSRIRERRHNPDAHR
jgi:hypothetical protein